MARPRASQGRDDGVDGGRWVFIADPRDYGWAELVANGETVWDGIRNAHAQRQLRDCRPGDSVLLYHTSPDKALVGTARVVARAEPDPEDERHFAIRIEPVTRLARPLPLAELRADKLLVHAGFVRMPRVAVHRLSAEEWDRVMKLTGTDPGAAAGLDPGDVGGP